MSHFRLIEIIERSSRAISIFSRSGNDIQYEKAVQLFISMTNEWGKSKYLDVEFVAAEFHKDAILCSKFCSLMEHIDAKYQICKAVMEVWKEVKRLAEPEKNLKYLEKQVEITFAAFELAKKKLDEYKQKLDDNAQIQQKRQKLEKDLTPFLTALDEKEDI